MSIDLKVKSSERGGIAEGATDLITLSCSMAFERSGLISLPDDETKLAGRSLGGRKRWPLRP